jgi:hypothetical protein
MSASLFNCALQVLASVVLFLAGETDSGAVQLTSANIDSVLGE